MPMPTDMYNMITKEMQAREMSTDMEIELTETEKGRYSIRYVPVYEAIIKVHFNEYLTDDKAGQCSAFYTDKFNTEDAVKILGTSTYNHTSITYEMKVPQDGSSVTFVGVGLEVAQYTNVEMIIRPGDNSVFLVAAKEMSYGGQSTHCDHHIYSPIMPIGEYKKSEIVTEHETKLELTGSFEITQVDSVDTAMKKADDKNTRFDKILEANRKEKDRENKELD